MEDWTRETSLLIALEYLTGGILAVVVVVDGLNIYKGVVLEQTG